MERVKQEDKYIQKNLDPYLKTSSILDFFQVGFYIWNRYKEKVFVLLTSLPPYEDDRKSKDPGNWKMEIQINNFFLLLLFK